MNLIAKKPCSFGGKQFYIGDEIPTNLVADAKMQEKLGVVTIVNDMKVVSGKEPGTLFTQEQVDQMLAEAIEEAVNNTVAEMEEENRKLQEAIEQCSAELISAEGLPAPDKIIVSVLGESDGENEQRTALPLSQEEVQQTFDIMQMNANAGVEAIGNVESENVLILLHAADIRKTVKDAAKRQVDKLFPAEDDFDGSVSSSEIVEDKPEGADT